MESKRPFARPKLERDVVAFAIDDAHALVDLQLAQRGASDVRQSAWALVEPPQALQVGCSISLDIQTVYERSITLVFQRSVTDRTV